MAVPRCAGGTSVTLRLPIMSVGAAPAVGIGGIGLVVIALGPMPPMAPMPFALAALSTASCWGVRCTTAT
jgi:hypothetical protein